ALAVLFKETVGHFDKVQKAATRLGATAEDVSALGYAAEQSGSNLEELEKASRIMLATLADAPETFDEFGLSAQKLKGLGLADKFEEIAESISRMDAESRLAAVRGLFGRSGASPFALLGNGGRGLPALPH